MAEDYTTLQNLVHFSFVVADFLFFFFSYLTNFHICHYNNFRFSAHSIPFQMWDFKSQWQILLFIKKKKHKCEILSNTRRGSFGLKLTFNICFVLCIAPAGNLCEEPKSITKYIHAMPGSKNRSRQIYKKQNKKQIYKQNLCHRNDDLFSF